MSYPFQFYNFSFAANQRILRPMFDPNKKHRLSGAIALMGMSYLVLSTRKPDWWFEDKDYSELFMQVVDRSGILGLYSEIAYRGIEASAAFGLHNPDNSWLKGRYNATGWDAAFGMLGATPNMYREWINGAYDLVNDRTEEGLKTISYNAPLLGLLGLDDDLRSIAGGRNR
jgi:biopolymer transport protein ExbB/TolQ